ncbi:MAG: NAD(P)H-hydrate dehydratase [Burkholderiales bacterium]
MRAKEKRTNSERILCKNGNTAISTRPLFLNGTTRDVEAWAHANLPKHALMQRAGLAIARLAMAIAPHAQVIWIACGPGNNGGDGYEAAAYLKRWGKSPVVTACSHKDILPTDAAASRQSALDAGVAITLEVPDQYDLCIDALFGIGKIRGFDPHYTDWIKRINSGTAPVLAVDTPSGLNAETGTCLLGSVHADYTLSLLTLKPGLFTASGREACGEIWFNSLGVETSMGMCAVLSGTPQPFARAHNTHKGNFGDVGVVGGTQGMTGAALLAAVAALHGGAGRVYLALLDDSIARIDTNQPELMFRNLDEIYFESMVIVAGCGGGEAITGHLEEILERSKRLVLDADALNAISRDLVLQRKLKSRSHLTTVLTPHPLEAARLMNIQGADVQANRLSVAQSMADQFGCTIVLKGSGTVIAAPSSIARINPTGNARLATAGTGDVLAGLIGAHLASGKNAFESACESAYRHGEVAEKWHHAYPLTAHNLARNL